MEPPEVNKTAPATHDRDGSDTAGLSSATTVADVMSQSVVSVSPDAPCAAVAALLYDHALNAVPVLGDRDELLGVASGADLLRGSLHNGDAEGWRGIQRRVGEVMTRDVVTIAPSATVSDAAALMSRTRLRWLPVLHQGRVVGVVSRSDLLHALSEDCLSDEQVCADVLAALAGSLRSPACEAVRVAVRDGIVTLSGSLPARSDGEQAVRTVELVDGVRGVRDELRFHAVDTQFQAGPVD